MTTTNRVLSFSMLMLSASAIIFGFSIREDLADERIDNRVQEAIDTLETKQLLEMRSVESSLREEVMGILQQEPDKIPSNPEP